VAIPGTGRWPEGRKAKKPEGIWNQESGGFVRDLWLNIL